MHPAPLVEESDCRDEEEVDHAEEERDQMAKGADNVAFVPLPGDPPVPIGIASSAIYFSDSSLSQTLENVSGYEKFDPALHAHIIRGGAGFQRFHLHSQENVCVFGPPSLLVRTLDLSLVLKSRNLPYYLFVPPPAEEVFTFACCS